MIFRWFGGFGGFGGWRGYDSPVTFTEVMVAIKGMGIATMVAIGAIMTLLFFRSLWDYRCNLASYDLIYAMTLDLKRDRPGVFRLIIEHIYSD